MCAASNAAMLPYTLKMPHPVPYLPLGANGVSPSALELQRMQLYDYSARLRYGLGAMPMNSAHSLGALYHPHGALVDPLAHAYFLHKHDPRARFVHEEPKPSHSYIGLIAMAIQGSKDKKLVLSDIYQWILDNYPYFRTRGPGWRNSIRHNLSLNDCFIKAGRSANGKGHYWAIHPANVDDFQKGDFRRRRAQRKVRKHMGLAVPDDDEDEDDSPPPPPAAPTAGISWQPSQHSEKTATVAATEKPNSTENARISEGGQQQEVSPRQTDDTTHSSNRDATISMTQQTGVGVVKVPTSTVNVTQNCSDAKPGKRRLFDVESLLAPDSKSQRTWAEKPQVKSLTASYVEGFTGSKNTNTDCVNAAGLPEDLRVGGARVSSDSQQTPSPGPATDKTNAGPSIDAAAAHHAVFNSGRLDQRGIGEFPNHPSAFRGTMLGLASPWTVLTRPHGRPLPLSTPLITVQQNELTKAWREHSTNSTE